MQYSKIWSNQYLYAFPRFTMINKVLRKIAQGQVKRMFNCTFHMAVSSMVLNPSENFNRETTSFATPPTSSIKPSGSDTSINNKQTLRLAVWTVSGDKVKGARSIIKLHTRPGQSGLAGVVKEKLIHFDDAL